MTGYWRDKVVVVTGASSGLGLALARACARQNARVVLAARDGARLELARTALGLTPENSLCVSTDIREDDDVQRLAALAIGQFGRIDALMNAAGKSDRGLATATPLSRYRELWELNFLGAVRCTQAVLPQLLAHGGHVVHVASLAAKVAPRFLGAYPSSKFPLAAFCQQLRLEHSHEGLHALLVCPGPLSRSDAGQRYAEQAQNLPAAAQQPGGGAKLKTLDPDHVAEMTLQACQLRRPELILPAKARWLFALSQLWPARGDRWLLSRSG